MAGVNGEQANEVNGSLKKLVASYFRFIDLREECDEWAWATLDDSPREDPEYAWRLIVALINAAPTKKHLESVAAGPLEDLLKRHGDQFIDRLEIEVAANTRFAFTVRTVVNYSVVADRLDALRERPLQTGWEESAGLYGSQPK